MSQPNHTSLGRVQLRSIDFERRLHFGDDAQLRLYKVEPGGRSLIGKALKCGWAAQPSEQAWRVEIIDPDAAEWADIRGAAEVEIETHTATQLFRVTLVNHPMAAGHAWVLELEAIGRV